MIGSCSLTLNRPFILKNPQNQFSKAEWVHNLLWVVFGFFVITASGLIRERRPEAEGEPDRKQVSVRRPFKCLP